VAHQTIRGEAKRLKRKLPIWFQRREAYFFPALTASLLPLCSADGASELGIRVNPRHLRLTSVPPSLWFEAFPYWPVRPRSFPVCVFCVFCVFCGTTIRPCMHGFGHSFSSRPLRPLREASPDGAPAVPVPIGVRRPTFETSVISASSC
jgi:hypothetical protein